MANGLVVRYRLAPRPNMTVRFTMQERPNIKATYTMKPLERNHEILYNRDKPDQHPILAITDLQDTLDSKQTSLTEEQLVAVNSGVTSEVVSKANSALQENDNITKLNNNAGYITSADIPAQQQANWTESDNTKVDYIKNKPTLATVATSGSYTDLSNKPTIPTVNNATLTIQKNGTTVKTFTANASNDVTANITVPTDTSDLTNNAGYITGITSSDVTTALGYTPYNSTNPSGYQENVIETVKVNGTALTPTDKAVNVTVPTTVADIATETQLNAINSGATSTNIGQITTNANDISDIKDLIPSQASDSNQLADKEFVNSSIATNTANFIGTFENLTTLEAYSSTITNNDYAFVINSVVTDNGNDWSTFSALDNYNKTSLTNFDYAWVVNGSKFDLYRFDIVEQEWALRVSDTNKEDVTLNTAYNRYKAVVSGNTTTWIYEYTLNNSSFTATQWAAINSGITSGDVSLIGTALQPNDNISDLVNDAGYTTNTGTVTSVQIQATSPVHSSTSTAQTTTASTTISLADGYGDTKNPYASKTANYVLAAPNGSNGTPSFRALVKADIPLASETAASGGTTTSLVTTGEKYTWNNKQNALSTQTAYTSKGTATKVPQITTNSLGQVTAITEVDITYPTEIPSQTGQSGKYLTTNGSNLSWSDVDSLPSQAGNSDKFLKTNGTNASWSALSSSDIPDLSATYQATSAKVTTINDNVTDNQYASAKAIKDYVNSKISDLDELAVEMSANGVFTRKLGAASLDFSPSTDVAAGIDDFKDKEIFDTYDCLVTYNSLTGKAEEYAPAGTYEYESHVGLPGYYVFTMFPKFYYDLQILDTGSIYISLSKTQKTGYKISPAHDRGGRTVDWIGIGKYVIGTESANANEPFAVRSGTCPITYTSVTSYETLVRQRGLRFFGYKEMLMIQLLATVKYASLNWQTAVSQGNTDGWTNKKAYTTTSNVDYVILKTSDWSASTSISTVPATLQCVAIGSSAATAVWYKVLSIEDTTVSSTSCKKITIDGTVSTTANSTLVYLGMYVTGATDNVLGDDGENTGGGTIAGTIGSAKRMCKNLGIEALFGNCCQNIGGIVNEVKTVGGTTTATMLVNPNPDGTVDYPTTSDRKGWTAITNQVPVIDQRYNYKFLPSTGLAEDIFLFGSSSGGFTGDVQYFTVTAGIKRVFYGGLCNDGIKCGGFFINANSDLDYQSLPVGGRCIYVPGL